MAARSLSLVTPFHRLSRQSVTDSVTPCLERRRVSVLTDDVLVAAARRHAYSLPLGSAPQPLTERDRATFADALRRIEHALIAVAIGADVAVDVRELPEQLATRLATSRAIAPAASDAVAALAPVLRRGDGGCADHALEVAAGKVAERLEGYLKSRASRAS